MFLFGCMANTVTYLDDDLIRPIDEVWDADTDVQILTLS